MTVSRVRNPKHSSLRRFPTTERLKRFFTIPEIYPTCASEFEIEDAQNIHLGDVFLTSDEEVAAFGTDGYDGIQGNIFIEETGDGYITDLSPLYTLKIVTGIFYISDVSAITLDGINNLRKAGAVTIQLCPNLEDLCFTSLREVGDFNLSNGQDMPGVTSFNSFRCLTTCTSSFQISSFPNLISLEGTFPSLSSITGAFAISDNPSLTSIRDAFANMPGEDITFLTIQDNDTLPQSIVDQFEDQLIATGFAGTTFISGNGPG